MMGGLLNSNGFVSENKTAFRMPMGTIAVRGTMLRMLTKSLLLQLFATDA